MIKAGMVTGFIANKEVFSIRDHFFTKDDVSYLTVAIRYRVAPIPHASKMPKPERQRDDSWRVSY